MLFNSQIFLFAFLPATLLVLFVLARYSSVGARAWLSAASLFFYGWWNPAYLVLILSSTVFNYLWGRLLAEWWQRAPVSRKALLVIGLVFNIGLLAYFKYAGFLIRTVDQVSGADLIVPNIILPLAISFFTFQKIAYLVDCYKDKAGERDFLDFLLFVLFFPQLIAGPIVHYSDMLPQFKKREVFRFNANNFVDGATLFLLGLAKKVVFADAFGHYANPAFDGAAHGAAVSFFAAWAAALSYTLQLYFDFSGYSDMAIGLARMMNIELPTNFWSPYKSRNIIEFWRRWHMTLSRFLREYIYIVLGGNRRGEIRRYANLMATMLIGGIWHGAGWTYVIWGGLHGFYLVANHLLVSVRGPARPGFWRALPAHFVTLLAVVVAWVIFRASTIDAAGRIFGGMLGWHGVLLPDQAMSLLPGLRHIANGAGNVAFLADSTVMGLLEMGVMLTAGFAIVLWSPNLYEMTPRRRLFLVALSFAFTLQQVLFAGYTSSFLYFQF